MKSVVLKGRNQIFLTKLMERGKAMPQKRMNVCYDCRRTIVGHSGPLKKRETVKSFSVTQSQIFVVSLLCHSHTNRSQRCYLYRNICFSENCFVLGADKTLLSAVPSKLF